MIVLNKVLKEIELLLRKYGCDGQADVVETATKHLRNNQDLQAFANLEWWGGSGSIADINLSIEPWRGDRPKEVLSKEKHDNRALRRALVVVHDHMRMQGIECPRADSWASTFKLWEDKGI